jgi:mono/diheme cytochrome c family protein
MKVWSRSYATSFLLLSALSLAVGCRATPPGKLETVVVTKTKHWVTVGDKDAKNPLTPTTDHVAAGKDNFSHYCVACHGLDGQNTGVPFAESMAPPVPSLASPEVQSYTDGQLKWIIENGVSPSGMPASRGILTDEEIWSTVLYIRHLPPAGSLGEPAMYSGEGPGTQSEKNSVSIVQRTDATVASRVARNLQR